jgi:hypothetical protein
MSVFILCNPKLMSDESGNASLSNSLRKYSGIFYFYMSSAATSPPDLDNEILASFDEFAALATGLCVAREKSDCSLLLSAIYKLSICGNYSLLTVLFNLLVSIS